MMLEKNYQTIILDLDGPLLDGQQRHYQCYADSLRTLGFHPIGITEYWRLKRAAVNRHQLLQLSQADAVYNRFMQNWLANIEEQPYLQLDRLQEQALKKLSVWQAAGIKLFLVTMRRNVTNLFWQLEQLKLETFFQEVIPVTEGQDKTTSIQSLILDKNKNDILWIGDTEIDIQSAKAIGVKVCAVTCGLRDEEFLRNLQPDYLVTNITKI